MWIGLIIFSIKSPPSHSKWQAYLSSLNINTAFRYAAESIAEFMNRGSILFHTFLQYISISDRVLGWSDIFEDASYMFSCGEVSPIFLFLLLILHIQAFLMIIFDIFWMLCLTLVFDRVFGQPDFSLRDVFSCYSSANVRTCLIDSSLVFEKLKIK